MAGSMENEEHSSWMSSFPSERWCLLEGICLCHLEPILSVVTSPGSPSKNRTGTSFPRRFQCLPVLHPNLGISTRYRKRKKNRRQITAFTKPLFAIGFFWRKWETNHLSILNTTTWHCFVASLVDEWLHVRMGKLFSTWRISYRLDQFPQYTVFRAT